MRRYVFESDGSYQIVEETVEGLDTEVVVIELADPKTEMPKCSYDLRYEYR
jgi:hypothetical protein